jgi:hypothetical protein
MSLYPEDVNFRVRSENWNTYDLGDDITLKTKVMLVKILKPQGISLDKVKEFNFQISPIQMAIFCPNKRKGTPSTQELTPEILEESIVRDADPKIIQEIPNEYELDNGTILRIRAVFTRVAITDKFSADGTPVVSVNIQIVPQVVLPPKPKKRTQSSVV